MSAEDWSPSDLPAVSYIRVAPTATDEAAREVGRQRTQIALAARRLGLRMSGEFVDVGYSGMSIDRPDLRRLLDYTVAHQVGYCIVATRDRLSEDPEHMADIDQALTDAGRDRHRNQPHRPHSELTASTAWLVRLDSGFAALAARRRLLTAVFGG